MTVFSCLQLLFWISNLTLKFNLAFRFFSDRGPDPSVHQFHNQVACLPDVLDQVFFISIPSMISLLQYDFSSARMVVPSKSMLWPVWWWWNAMPSFFFVEFSIFLLCFFLHQLACSLHRFLIVTDVWPMYFFGQSLHGIEYITFFRMFFSMLLPFLRRMSPSVCVFLYTTVSPNSSCSILYSFCALGWNGIYIYIYIKKCVGDTIPNYCHIQFWGQASELETNMCA